MTIDSANTLTERLPMPIWPAERYPLEPVHGWIHRAAERNYAFSTDAFVDSLGLSGRDWDYDELLKIVEQMPIDGYADILDCTPKRSGGGYVICGHRVSSRFVSKSERRVCPQCLDEKRYVRTWFDFVPLASCPDHNVSLIEGLPQDLLDWRHTEIGWTRSGVKLGAEHANTHIASALDHYLYEALSGTQVSLPDHLRDAKLDEILTASMCIGKLFRSDENYLPTARKVRELCQLGFGPLSQGSKAVTQFLRRAGWLQTDYDRFKYQARCNNASNMLQGIAHEHIRQMLVDAFARARVENGIAIPSGRLSKYDGEGESISVKGAARRLGMSPQALRRLLSKLSIVADRTKDARSQRLTHEQVENLRSYIEDGLSADEAARHLGCTAQDLRSLVARRLLRADFYVAGLTYYAKSDILAFIDEMSLTRLSGSDLATQPVKSFAIDKNIALAEVCAQIRQKDGVFIVELDPHVPFFDGLRVASAEKVARRRRVRPRAQVRSAITYAEAAARLGTTHNAVKCLIAASFISVDKDSKNCERICERSLKKFEERYVKAAAYASILNCFPRYALKMLRGYGVQPINDWMAAGARYVDWREVEQLTGFKRPEVLYLAEWHSIQKALAEQIAVHAVPATTRVTGDRAIEVRATSGRWSFLIEKDGRSGQYSLVTHFTARRQPGRLRRLLNSSVEPSKIWPGAVVSRTECGGFVIVDNALRYDIDEPQEASLIAHVVARSHEIHRIFF